MNIIVLNDHGFVSGGAAQVAIASLNALADAGHQVTFVSSVGPIDKSIDNKRVKTICFGYHDLIGNPSKLSAAWHGIWDRRTAKRFGELLNNYDPDETIIHLHTWVKSLSSSVVREAVKRNFRIVCTLHDYFTVCPNGGLYNFQQQQQCSLIPMTFRCISTNCDSRNYSQKLWRVGRQFIQQYIGRIPDGITNFITVSDYSENILRKFLPHDAVYYRVNNPINVEKKSLAIPKDNTVFSFVGRLSPEKGAIVFAMASKLSGVCARFIGAGDEHASILAANPDSEMLGWLSHDDVLKKIRSSRALVFPSLCHETQGLAVMEAAALGVPSIVADTCAASENIIDGVTGLLFRSNDVADLSEKLAILHNNPEFANQLGAAAYEKYWASPSTMQNHVSDLLSCYSKIVRKAE